MGLRKIRFVERWKRLENVEGVFSAFLFYLGTSTLLFWYLHEHMPGGQTCRYINISFERGACIPVFLCLGSLFACLLAVNAFKIFVNLLSDFFRPLPNQDFSLVLRAFLRLKRMHLERVLKEHSWVLDFTTLDDNHKPYRSFVLKIDAIREFTFYDINNVAVSASFIFQNDAILEFSQVADLAGLEYARVNVSCQRQGRCFSGQLELEADRYELRMMPRQRV